MSLELPPLVRSGVFLFFYASFEGQGSSFFAVFFAPYSKVGNSQLLVHSTRFCCLRFYCITILTKVQPIVLLKPAEGLLCRGISYVTQKALHRAKVAYSLSPELEQRKHHLCSSMIRHEPARRPSQLLEYRHSTGA